MRKHGWAATLLLILAACDVPPTAPLTPAFAASPRAVAASASGGGHYLLLDALDVQFAFNAVQHGNGKAAGRFHIKFSNSGFDYDIRGAVTCLTTDPANGRAWIGGVVTHNETTDPAFQTPIHQVGRDVWFRVLDAGEGHGAVDRTSFYGFEGAAGIITSADYCAAMIWPEGNARTWSVTRGNIQVR